MSYVKIGVGGPVGSGKTALIERLTREMTKAMPKYKESYVIVVVDKYVAALEFCALGFRRMKRYVWKKSAAENIPSQHH